MKKIIYIIMLTLVGALTITSCTEENVAPQTNENTGGGVSEDKVK